MGALLKEGQAAGMDYHTPIRFLYLELHRRVMRRIEKSLEPFADALAVWLNELAERYRPRWRESWERFLAEWEAHGVIVAPESKQAVEDWIESAARFVGLADAAEVAPESVDASDYRYGPITPHPRNPHLSYRLPKDSRLTARDVVRAREIAAVTRALRIAIKQKTDELERPGLLAQINPFGPDALTLQAELASLTRHYAELTLLFAELGYEQIEWTTLGYPPASGIDQAELIDDAAGPEAGLKSVFIDDSMTVAGVASLTKLAGQLLVRTGSRMAGRIVISIPKPELLADEATTILKQLTNEEYNALIANMPGARTVLSQREIIASANSSVARMNFGKAVERLVAARIEQDPNLKTLFKYVGKQKNTFDFLGIGRFEGLKFDITTPGQTAKHLARPYGEGLIIIDYISPRLP